MAQCYAESKPIGTFDMHGGRLYCSGYGGDHLKPFRSYSKYAAASAANSAEMIVPMFFKQQKHNQTSRASLETVSTSTTLEAANPPEADRIADATVKLGLPSDEIPKPPVMRKLSGELTAPTKKADSKTEIGSYRSDVDGAAAAPKPSSRHSSGEITSEVGEAPSTSQPSKLIGGVVANGSGGTLGGTRTRISKAAASSHQSWPSSPANFRPAPRTRNLSEGSFSMIFPEEGHSRLYFTSPTRARSKEPTKVSDVQDSKAGFATNSSFPDRKQDGVVRVTPKRGELTEGGGKARSYTGSPPRTLNKEVPSIRHSRNVSDGNWGVFNSGARGGNLFRSNLSASKPQVPAAEKATPPSIKPTGAAAKVQSEGMNCGFVSGGSFARGGVPGGEKTSVAQESTAPSYGSVSKGGAPASSNDPQKPNGKKVTAESYGTGNVFLMGESMLLKKALTSKDAEEVKNIGNDQYKKGHFLEALSLYDRAISLSPGQAPYHSNRAAVLAALGRLVEAVQECQQAIVLDPSYSRAHLRLGTLFLRLGWTDEAKRHLQGNEGGDLQRLESVALHLAKCHDARRLRDWQMVIRESDAAVVAGADSSVQAYALKAEALLNLCKVNEADRAILCAQRNLKQKHVVDERVYFIAQAKIDLAQGRFEEALQAAEKASANEPFNAEVSGFDKKVRRLVKARATGNDLFKAGKFLEASTAYGEGLELDPENAILYCNRAACRSKLRLWEKAIEDCNAALNVQPSYTKALLRRAQCYTQLERWDSALEDYMVLKSKLPGDVEVARALFEVQIAQKKARGEEVYKVSFGGGGVEEVYSPDQFKEAITSPGLAVVHFITRWSERCKQITPFINLLSKRYPSVNFVKVDIEDHPFLAKTEGVGTVPTFKLYKNGLKVTEMLGPSQQKLEDAVQHYIL
ncbi:TPR repeat-containing thioredoxin TTL1-like [Selaginella moellendorffii]|uniref:TPR repeat-containing thioredoxin TTL1-like n=1 Tax=Selaginella moellendorffii TaxID=88036 RepID=UPI000D1CAB8B|nr:TPR repeat-containing thioredoxin TTL1-like [Selaginella moellendorffii]XP_024520347.1 TPR repeat-containing thioredoxin TTL1-like [Selaginella moellendorffii]XP_024520348.1 TPR repeat-containing thioredoxin TTL1-like [Selaginella moellendorffii]XP_024520349.1 TPR repeat-containing thioredoxin TTL1-like [Selaginella moellendorffii]XP_024520350.1 TPR repeat-containing thioredoxin TTL1-like [Selaginella moellendorffii]|eukprot:XP_024520346.1 TPR repeat-containing thioredoxin TTL1-like [Selaginella moellendorffii]